MRKKYIYILFLIASSFLVYQSCNSVEVEDQTKPVSNIKPEYVGTATCQSCHTKEHESWQESHHKKAMELPTESTVLADFNNVEFRADDVKYFFYKDRDKFKINVTENGKTDTFTVAHTFGFTPLQQFLVETENGKYQALRATWNSEEYVWFHQFAGEKIPPSDWMHFTNQSANWNSMCASCHSTDVKKGFNEANNSYNTSFSELTVGCESCHGAGSNHIKVVENNTYKKEESGFPSFGEGNMAQINMCGGCHARREQFYDQVQPGDAFHDAFAVSWISDRNFHTDGQIRDEDYVLSSFLSSKMFHNDVMCTDCHNAHSGKLKLEGNKLCMQCHEPELNTPGHHFHEQDTEGAACVNCHMTGETYMGNDFRRDHSFRIPRPDQSVAFGTPNACVTCHTEKSNTWAANQVSQWYGKKRTSHFSDFLLPGRINGDANALATLANDTAQPAISRATAIYYLAQQDISVVVNNLDGWTRSSEVLVRKAAQQSLRDFPKEQRMLYVLPALNDKARTVRIEAAMNVADIPATEIPSGYKKALEKATNEYKTFLAFNADFPDGQAQIAQYEYKSNNYSGAISAYKKALKIDSLRTDIRMNLAVIYNMNGQNNLSLNQLNLLLKQEPNARAYYLRGLLLAEMNQTDNAIDDLILAIEQDAYDPTYYYNLALLYNKKGMRKEMKQTVQTGLQIFPENQRLQSIVNL